MEPIDPMAAAAAPAAPMPPMPSTQPGTYSAMLKQIMGADHQALSNQLAQEQQGALMQALREVMGLQSGFDPAVNHAEGAPLSLPDAPVEGAL